MYRKTTIASLDSAVESANCFLKEIGHPFLLVIGYTYDTCHLYLATPEHAARGCVTKTHRGGLTKNECRQAINDYTSALYNRGPLDR